MAAAVAALAVPAGVRGKEVAAASPQSGLEVAAGIVGGIVILLAVAIFVRWRWARRGSRRGERPDGVPASSLSRAELAAQASRALIQTDDAVLTSEQELGFAIAMFGERAMARFSAAVEAARAERREAFRLWQLIDDSPASEASARSRLTEICARCSSANRRLDEQAAAFDRAQNMRARAPQLVAEIDAHIAQQAARMNRTRQVLDRLAAKYTPDAIVAVASNPGHAATRLEFAADSLASAEQAIAAGDAGKAAVLLQAAEAGADQATDLLTGVLHMEAELTQAASAVPAALREIDAEIAEATTLVTDAPDEEGAALVARARAVSDGVRSKLAAGPFDALVALRDMQRADAALDRALAGVRTEQARRQRAIALLDEAMLVARSSLTAAEDFITTRRGGVGPTARTRLAEARRHFEQAIGLAQPEPEAALTEAQDADELALQARALAEQDVAGFESAGLSADGVAAAWAANTGAGIRGAILGGILIDAWAGGVGPGSFGGAGTRDRHAVSHREYSFTSEDSVSGSV
jgi:hypothetical protein